MRSITYQVCCGNRINVVIKEAVLLSRKQKCFVRFNFNDVPLWASPNKSANTLLWEWNGINHRRYEKYRRSAKGLEAQRDRAAKIATNQDSLTHVIRTLPGLLDINDMDALMEWLRSFIYSADHVGVDINAAAGLVSGAYDYLSLLFESKGYVEGQHVGQEPGWFNARERMGRYIIGQTLSFFKIRTHPHPGVCHFIDTYFRLESVGV